MNNQTLSSLTTNVVESIAEKEDVDPLELQPPLYEAVDTEALNKVLESLDGDGLVQFHYQGYEVTVQKSGEVEVADKLTI